MDVKLVMFREDGSRKEIPLGPGTTSIGRKNDCGIRIPLGIVSRRHADITLEGNTVTLRDAGAANGTYLNNRRVTEEVLEAGDQIMIGPVVFTIRINGEPGDDEIMQIRTKVPTGGGGSTSPTVGTSKHVYMSDEDIDPIAALEELASSADQTAIRDDDDL